MKTGAIQFCPVCQSQTLDIQPIQTRNTIAGEAGDFYCRSCGASGDIDLDGKSDGTLPHPISTEQSAEKK